jgi:hypothetical protein
MPRAPSHVQHPQGASTAERRPSHHHHHDHAQTPQGVEARTASAREPLPLTIVNRVSPRVTHSLREGPPLTNLPGRGTEPNPTRRFAPVIFLPPRLPLRARGIKDAQPLVIRVPAAQADFILPSVKLYGVTHAYVVRG